MAGSGQKRCGIILKQATQAAAPVLQIISGTDLKQRFGRTELRREGFCCLS